MRKPESTKPFGADLSALMSKLTEICHRVFFFPFTNGMQFCRNEKEDRLVARNVNLIIGHERQDKIEFSTKETGSGKSP